MNKRVLIDIKNLKKNGVSNLIVDKNIIIFTLKGPKDSVYEGGKWQVRVEVSDDYPYKSPSVGFLTKIYHPNVDFNSGSICLNVLNQTWSPIYNLSHIHDTFIPQLLQYPNADDPLNEDAAKIYLEDYNQFTNLVKSNIKIHCEF